MRSMIKPILVGLLATVAAAALATAPASAHQYYVEGKPVDKSTPFTAVNFTATAYKWAVEKTSSEHQKYTITCTTVTPETSQQLEEGGIWDAGGPPRMFMLGSGCTAFKEGVEEPRCKVNFADIESRIDSELVGTKTVSERLEADGEEPFAVLSVMGQTSCLIKHFRWKIFGTPVCELPEAGVEKVEHEVICITGNELKEKGGEGWAVQLEMKLKEKVSGGKKFSAR